MRVLLITPPMCQLNSPYPATPYLSAHLRRVGHTVEQADLGLELILALFTRESLSEVREICLKMPLGSRSDAVSFFLEAFEDYQNTVEPVIRFLQGRDSALALRISARQLLPEGPRFVPLGEHEKELLEQFGAMGVQDRAKYIASLYLDDLSDVLREAVDPRFEFSRYGESLASSQNSFQPLYESLKLTTLIDKKLIEIFAGRMQRFKPDIVGFTCPFPGNVYAALRMAGYIKKTSSAKVVLGGGYVNTELRDLSDARIFEFIDYLVYDDGEKPFEVLLEQLEKGGTQFLRTKFFESGKIKNGTSEEKNSPFNKTEGPDYEGLDLNRYISMLELPNPMHRMWSDFRWNKMVLAHGCYWKRCTFCDVNLDYIGRFEPHKATALVDHIEKVMAQTGSSGFHFVDEAAPPALLKSLSQEIIKRGLKIVWWGNLRFDKQFTPEVCQLMSDAGCVAVTGGLEVASPRILALIEKGVTVKQVKEVTRNFKRAGIFVHAYLMYGFPSQTQDETIESLETVRELFANGCLDSAHWHRFLCTAHSPVGREPERFGIRLQPLGTPSEGLFARYEIPFKDSVKTDHARLGQGLRKALYNYMHGIGLERNVKEWFKSP